MEMKAWVVSYRNSTSNHNNNFGSKEGFPLYLIEILHQTTTAGDGYPIASLLYLIEILHQTTTCSKLLRLFAGCILSKFYIKPQPNADTLLAYWLYLIEILHQTTTLTACHLHCLGCILSKFYIKPQPPSRQALLRFRCILSKFYIKPQPSRNRISSTPVVSYRNSTSNHNMNARRQWRFQVVSYRNSTSNHNVGPHID